MTAGTGTRPAGVSLGYEHHRLHSRRAAERAAEHPQRTTVPDSLDEVISDRLEPAIAVIGGFSVSSLLRFFGLPMLYRLLKAA